MLHPRAQRGVCLALPGLLAAEAAGSDGLDTPALCRFLSRAIWVRASRQSLESIVYRWFNGGGSDVASSAALLGYRHELANATLPAGLMRTDPVYQQMDVSSALLADQSLLGLRPEEAVSLIETLNRHFVGEGIWFEMSDPSRWYCHMSAPLKIKTSTLSQAVGRDVAMLRPSGESARRWRSWLAEIEMLLYEHPVNIARAECGEVPVNSLWLWGEGKPSSAISAQVDVFSDNFYVESLASFAGAEVKAVARFSDLSPKNPVLVVDDRLATAAATADVSLRETTLQELEQNVFKPLWNNLNRSGWPQAILWVGGEQWLKMDLSRRRQFWNRPKSLEHFILMHSGSADSDDAFAPEPSRKPGII